MYVCVFVLFIVLLLWWRRHIYLLSAAYVAMLLDIAAADGSFSPKALYLADRKYSYIIYLHTHICTHVFMYLAEWIHQSKARAHGQIYAESWVREYSKRICHNFRRSGIFSKIGIQIAVSSAKKMKSDEHNKRSMYIRCMY